MQQNPERNRAGISSSFRVDIDGAIDPSTSETSIFANETGFQSFSSQLLTSGSYTLGIGIVNAADGEIKSGLLIDSVDVKSVSTPVPTPALLPGLLALGLRVLKKGQKEIEE